MTEVAATKKRRNNSLEAEGAEFLVLASLLIEGIQAFKAYTRFPGYDLMAVDPERGTSCRVQVKSRWATDYSRGFPLKSTDCDFVVHVALNRGYSRQRKNGEGGRTAPALYVLPVGVVLPVITATSSWGPKVMLRDIDEVGQYLDAWHLIRAQLAGNGASP
ncbi:hypothetical protein [Actinopolymorpha sp. B9G3]|uniref:hypothetical protein n=1 Tax=Actinopolymorpha sp. B9G3 TaxID=3158970 RepID=UPI0032D98731